MAKRKSTTSKSTTSSDTSKKNSTKRKSPTKKVVKPVEVVSEDTVTEEVKPDTVEESTLVAEEPVVEKVEEEVVKSEPVKEKPPKIYKDYYESDLASTTLLGPCRKLFNNIIGIIDNSNYPVNKIDMCDMIRELRQSVGIHTSISVSLYVIYKYLNLGMDIPLLKLHLYKLYMSALDIYLRYKKLTEAELPISVFCGYVLCKQDTLFLKDLIKTDNVFEQCQNFINYETYKELGLTNLNDTTLFTYTQKISLRFEEALMKSEADELIFTNDTYETLIKELRIELELVKE